jgi:chemotaxis-related protein WspB
MIESPARPLQLTQQLFQLMVRFQVGDQQYAMASHHIQEILPAVDLYPIDSPRPDLAGLLNYHGRMIPVLDLNQLMKGRSSHRHFGTRIVLLNQTPNQPQMAFLAERIIDTLTLDQRTLVDVPQEFDQAPYLGQMILQHESIIRCFLPEGLGLLQSPPEYSPKGHSRKGDLGGQPLSQQ